MIPEKIQIGMITYPVDKEVKQKFDSMSSEIERLQDELDTANKAVIRVTQSWNKNCEELEKAQQDLALLGPVCVPLSMDPAQVTVPSKHFARIQEVLDTSLTILPDLIPCKFSKCDHVWCKFGRAVRAYIRSL